LPEITQNLPEIAQNLSVIAQDPPENVQNLREIAQILHAFRQGKPRSSVLADFLAGQVVAGERSGGMEFCVWWPPWGGSFLIYSTAAHPPDIFRKFVGTSRGDLGVRRNNACH
jgi:hypothetical protein